MTCPCCGAPVKPPPENPGKCRGPLGNLCDSCARTVRYWLEQPVKSVRATLARAEERGRTLKAARLRFALTAENFRTNEPEPAT